MDTQTIIILVIVVVVVLILRSISAKQDPLSMPTNPMPTSIPTSNPNSPPATGTLTDEEKVIALVKQGSLIEAIKSVRAQTGCGLEEAKDYIELIQMENEETPPSTTVG